MWMYERNRDIEIFANDYNEDIINIYKNIRDNLPEFLEVVDEYDINYIRLPYADRKLFYYDQRNIHAYDNLSDTHRAGLLFSLLKTSFNGIWQINQNTNNRFGTPFGLGNEKGSIYKKKDILDFHDFSQNITFMVGDFMNVKSYVQEDSYLYLDPPYRDTHTKYTTLGFDDSDQSRMISLMNYAHEKGSKVSMSNKHHNDRFFEDQLIGFDVLLYDVTYTAGRGSNKSAVKEGLWKNYRREKTSLEELLG
jgi:DNA adenine methylase